MDREIKQRIIMRSFWQNNKEQNLSIKSIDMVYKNYLEYLEKNNPSNIPAMNKYIFRTYIRKNGYNNSN